jgi:hypothetical protein
MIAVAFLLRRRRLWVSAAATGLLALVPTAVAITAVAGVPPGPGVPSAEALADIPADALGAYQEAAAAYDVDWATLAAIGKIECEHGRSQQPGCRPDTTNAAGARGFMQFLGSTWRRGMSDSQLEPRTSPPVPDGDGYATDGDGDGSADPWSWPDATFSAARLLRDNDASSDLAAAVYAYNHDHQYVIDVLGLADRYRLADAADADTLPGADAGPVPLVHIQGITVHALLGGRLAAMLTAAQSSGLDMGGSGYRTREEQLALRRAHCGTSDYGIYDMPPAQCSPPTARPGESLHERGLAIDFTCGGALISGRQDPCYGWLASHAAAFSFFNLPSEPWHWSVNGQ